MGMGIWALERPAVGEGKAGQGSRNQEQAALTGAN